MLRYRKLRDICVVKTLFLRNIRLTLILVTLLYSYVKTPCLTQQKFNCSSSIIESPDIYSMLTIKIPERGH